MRDLHEALVAVQAPGSGTDLTARIAGVERRLQSMSRDDTCRLVAGEETTEDVLQGALLIKQIAGQINVVVHAVGSCRPGKRHAAHRIRPSSQRVDMPPESTRAARTLRQLYPVRSGQPHDHVR